MKKSLIVFAAIAAALVLCLMGARGWLRHTVRASIRASIERSIDGAGASVEMGRIDVDISHRTATVRDITIRARNNDIAHGGGALVSLDVKIGSVSARGITYRKSASGGGRTFRADSIAITSGSASIVTDNDGRSTLIELGGVDAGIKKMRTATLTLDTFACGFGDGRAEKTDVRIHDIVATGLDFEKLLHSKTLSVDSVALVSADVKSYRDKKLFRKPHVRPLIYQSIQRIGMPVEIGVIAFEGVNVEYEELAKDGDAPGRITVTDGRGTVRDLTNISAGHERFFTVEFAATLMGSGRMEVECLFPVRAGDDHWEIRGGVGPTDMTSLNEALVPLMNLRVTSGRVQSLDFHLTGTSLASHIEMTMAYADLEVAFLKKHDHSSERRFLTNLVDDILIRKDNPARGGKGPLRTGEGDYKHDPERSMYNYIWRSFIPAIIKTVI